MLTLFARKVNFVVGVHRNKELRRKPAPRILAHCERPKSHGGTRQPP
jgi:hypothetical protein